LPKNNAVSRRTNYKLLQKTGFPREHKELNKQGYQSDLSARDISYIISDNCGSFLFYCYWS